MYKHKTLTLGLYPTISSMEINIFNLRFDGKKIFFKIGGN
jgi:hypothetical protein